MRGETTCRRILMTADAVGGVWDYALQLAEGLGDSGVAVTLATMGPRPRDDQRMAARQIPSLRLLESEYRLEWADQPWDDVAKAGSWLLDLEARVQPDIVHLNGYAHASLPWSAPTLVVAHSCVCSWWTAVRGGDASDEWDQYRRTVRDGVHAASALVAPSAAMLRAISAHYGTIGGTVIPNGRDATRFEIGPKEPLVLSAGRLWDEGKNVTALAAIAGKLPWHVALAGAARPDPAVAPTPAAQGPSPDGHAEENEPRDPVQYLGRLSAADVRRWMARASIYVMPARYEPFGLSILEAGLSACALVLGDIPSLREHWDGAALFVPPDDREALRKTVQRLIDSPDRRAELGARARARGCEFTVERMVRGYSRVYDELLEPPERIPMEAAPCAS